MGVQIRRYEYVELRYDDREDEAVKTAAASLQRDLRRVLSCGFDAGAAMPAVRIVIGTAGISEEAGRKADWTLLLDEQGRYRKEAFLLQEKDGELIIAGSDRRGTVFGIYDFCENFLGVSPWYFWADVPVKQKLRVDIADHFLKVDYPSVEYRGIFINDEEELEHWVQRYMGEETIGVKTYEKIFELLLRLKLNYIWPAMHVNSFNMKRENGSLADRMGIVVGTSHCDMLMRSNNREWKPWIAKKGYTDVAYDFSVPGKNREVLKEYWRESIEQNRDFEVSYTLGMRGIHDSGFETAALAEKSGEELLQAKIALLDSVIEAQQSMLKETLGHETLKTFVPYKEVLELYDNGLQVPEDLTLIWVNDNYGYVRRYPDEKEKKRKGGNGIYYHNSYWAPPGGSYLFICSIPLAHTRNELQKAWEEGIRKIWVTNFGAVKPLEQQLSYYAAFAWQAGKEGAESYDERLFLERWIDRTFSGGYGKELAALLTEFDQLTNVRKIEQMDADAFSQSAYGDEAAARIHRYEKMFAAVNRIWKALPRREQDAFFQMVGMKVHAAYFTNLMYYYADRSNLCMGQGKYRAAQKYTDLCKAADRGRRSMLYYYNHIMADGKWNGILTPEDFPPPRTAMHPACMPPLEIGEEKGGEPRLVVTLWNDASEVRFAGPAVKWIELGNCGAEPFDYVMTGPEWVRFPDTGSCVKKGTVTDESRICFEVDWDVLAQKVKKGECREKEVRGSIVICSADGRLMQSAAVAALTGAVQSGEVRFLENAEEDGRITVEADSVRFPDGWKKIPNLGRDSSSLAEARREGAVLSYPVTVFSKGRFLLELHRFPTLNSMEAIRIGVSVDGKEAGVMETEANDEYRGNWSLNVRNNVDKMYMELPFLEEGRHVIAFHAMSRYFAFTRFVIYTEERKENNLGRVDGGQRLPEEFDAASFVRSFYGEEAARLLPRPVIYLPPAAGGDCLAAEDILIQPEAFGEPIDARRIVESGRTIAAEEGGAVKLEAAAVLAQSPFAHTENADWQYCNSPSHGETGLAMYIREAGLRWNADAGAPALCYRLRVTGGRYRIWIRMLMWGSDTSHFTIGIDGEIIPEEAINGGKSVWRYSNEQVWKWIPVYTAQLLEGEHSLRVLALCSHLRFEQIYVTKGEELPPAMG